MYKSQVGSVFFFFQAEDGIRDRSPSRGLGDVYKRQLFGGGGLAVFLDELPGVVGCFCLNHHDGDVFGTVSLSDDTTCNSHCLLYTSDAADEEDSVDLGGRRIIKKK